MNQPNQPSPAASDARLFPTANDLPEETRVAVVEQLNRSLADTTDLMTQLKFAHWNVKGINFYQLHLLFDEVAEVLAEHADMLAERATSLGGQAMGTARMAASTSRIPELPPDAVTGAQYLELLVDRVADHAANLRADIDRAAEYGDEDTADLYTEISREVDQQLYFLESHLQTEPVGTVGQAGGARTAGGQRPPGTGHGPPQRTTFGGPPARGGGQPPAGGGGQPPAGGGGQPPAGGGGQPPAGGGGQPPAGGPTWQSR